MKLAPKTMEIIFQVNKILYEYHRMDIKMNLRQIYYQFIARDLFSDDWVDEAYNLKNGLAPDTKNTQKNYKRLGTIINKGRMAGHIDWDRVVDQTRAVKDWLAYESPQAFLERVLPLYQRDLWEDQGMRMEIWIEKEALTGVIAPVCKEMRVPYFACKGCPSQSSMYEARNRILRAQEDNELHVILYMGDHDPTGLDIDRDVKSRLEKMTRGDVSFSRIALTMKQIDELQPPPNPVKHTDARSKRYEEQYGESNAGSWTLWSLDIWRTFSKERSRAISKRRSGSSPWIRRKMTRLGYYADNPRQPQGVSPMQSRVKARQSRAPRGNGQVRCSEATA